MGRRRDYGRGEIIRREKRQGKEKKERVTVENKRT